MQRHHAAGGNGRVDTRLRSAQMERAGGAQATQMGPQWAKRPGDRRLDARQRDKRGVVQVLACRHAVVVGKDDERVSGGPVPLEEVTGPVSSVGLCRVAVELGLAILAGDRVGVSDPGRHHPPEIRGPKTVALLNGLTC